METAYRKILGIYSLCLVLMVILLAGIPVGVIAADTIKIGVLEPFSGPMEALGRAFFAGLQFAVDEQNAKGGLLGKKIETIKEDSELKPDVATRRARSLVYKDNVDFLAVGAGSNIAIALTKVAESEKKILINYGAAADSFTGKEFTRYAFRTAASSYSYSATFLRFLMEKPYRRVYLIANDYVATYETFSAFKKAIQIIPDAKIVGEDTHPTGAKEFGPYITKMIAAKPDIVWILTFTHADLINLISQARKLGLETPLFSHVIYEPYILNALKDDAVGTYFLSTYEIRVKTPENEAMVARFHEQHKNDKDYLTWWPYGIIGYSICGWKMTFAAVEKAGSLDTEKIINAYEGFSYQTPVGLWTMRKCDHQVMCPTYVGQIKEGWNPYFNGSINPEVKFPWVGPEIMTVPAKDVVIPATPDYNPRCP